MNQLLEPLQETKVAANVLCVDQFSNLGGGQRSLADLLPAISGRGWVPSVALPGEGRFADLLKSHGYRTHSFPFGTYATKKKPFAEHFRYALEFPSLVNYLTELVNGNNIDLLYVNGPRLVPPAAWVAWRTGTPLVFHCHNRLMQQSAIALTGQTLELASAHVIACCHYAAEPLRGYVAPERLRIVYNGVEQMGTGDVRLPRRIRKIGVVGRVEAGKGQLEFVQAARLLSREASGCRFAVIGAPMFSGLDYYRKVTTSARGLAIEFIDWQDNLVKTYSELDLLVVPSGAMEATTRVILEAYSAGVPVVAFPTGGIPEILEDQQTGFLTEAATAEALARRILSVLRMDQEMLWAVVKRARKAWSDRFTLQAYRNRVCGVLDQAMEPKVQACYRELREPADALTD